MHIHFIAGLPRSGSTLFASLLRQNPRFAAQMSSPLEEIYSAALAGMSAKNAFHTFITPAHRTRVLKGLIENYYADMGPEKIVFDTNRNWPLRLTGLHEIFPSSRMICCVRDIASILNSFEHLVRKNPFEVSKLWNWDPSVNVYGRVELLMHNQNGTVGRALGALQEAFASEQKQQMIFIEFDELIAHPEKTMRRVYELLNEPYFNHDFLNVSYEEAEFDARLGLVGMHTIHDGVGLKKRDTTSIIPTNLVNRLQGLEFWRGG